MNLISVIIIGAGDRGATYAQSMKAKPDKYRVIGVAEPIEGRRRKIQEMFELPEEMCFSSWEDILDRPKFADLAVIATMDDMHYAPAMKAIGLGYHLLLEKPAAQSAQECADIALAVEKKGVSALVCHVLRYAPFFKAVKKIILDDMIGDIVSIAHVEAVGNLHQSHSYVRGNWHSEKETTPMLLAKCCHDIDIIQWLIDKPCKKVSSFGDLNFFRSEYAPEGAPVRCADGGCPVADTCPYNCIRLYYEDKNNSWFRRAATRGIVKETEPTDEEVMTALRTTDYGLCVFHANNDVVDHQVVNMEFAGGVTASLTMTAFNKGGRFIRIFGTKGELTAYASDTEITVYTFADRETKKIPVMKTTESILGGHGGGDDGIVSELYDYLSGSYKGCCAADINISVKNHLIGFAAEKARHNDIVVSIDEFDKEYGFLND